MSDITKPLLDWEESSEELDPNLAWTAQTDQAVFAVSVPYPYHVDTPPPSPDTPWLLEVIRNDVAGQEQNYWFTSDRAARLAGQAIHQTT
jgi:hypothetical protein